MSTATSSLVPKSPDRSYLDSPEVKAAIARLRTALEELREDYEPVLRRAQALPAEAKNLSINDQDELALAEGWIRGQVLPVKDAVKAQIGPWKKLAKTVHSFFCDLEGLGLDPTAEAIDIANQEIRDFHRREKIAREEAERRARELQREAERRALLARGPYLVVMAIAQAAQCQIEDAERERIAKTAEAAGDTEAAEAMRGEIGSYQPQDFDVPPVTVAPAVHVPEKPKVKGLAVQEDWKGRLKADMDQEAAFNRVFEFAYKNPAYRQSLFALVQSGLNRLAKTHKSKLSEVVPGLEGFDAGRVAHRRR